MRRHRSLAEVQNQDRRPAPAGLTPVQRLTWLAMRIGAAGRLKEAGSGIRKGCQTKLSDRRYDHREIKVGFFAFQTVRE